MKKSLLLFAIICCILVLVPSCRKKGDGSENTSLVQSLISSESTSNLEPVVVVPQPQSAEKRAQDSVEGATTSVAAKDEKTEVASVETVVETVEEPVAEDSSLEPETAPEETLTAPLSVETTEEEMPAEVADENEDEEETASDAVVFYSFPYSYNGYSSYLEIADTYTTLTVPEGVSDEDIAAVAAMISEAYPDESSLITYTIAGGTLTLYYPRQTRDYIDSIVPFVEAEAMTLLDMYPVASEEEKVVEEVIEKPVESAPVSEVKEEETSALLPPAVTVREEEAVSEKGSFIKNWSIAAYAEPKFNITSEWGSPFVLGFGLRGEASFSEKLAMGLKLQYDMSSYFSSSLYLKWTFAGLDKFDFYFRGGAGAEFGIGANKGQYAFLVDASLGMDYNFSSSLSLFAEITGEWSIPRPGLELGAAVGLKYTF